jgi:CD2 antigen cytoplasmic tail-binding protein 2
MIFRADGDLLLLSIIIQPSTKLPAALSDLGQPSNTVDYLRSDLSDRGQQTSRMASARPKRAGEEFARTHHAVGDDDAGPSSSKRARFDLRNPSALAPDALDEDAVLDVDEIGRRGQGVRRNAVNLDGFESDSENEGFDARAEARARDGQRPPADADDDMFAEPQEDRDAAAARRKTKKTVRFLEDSEIEGQVASSRGGRSLQADLSRPTAKAAEEESESESESDVADEERARIDADMDEELGAGSKKAHAPLLDAFNMRAEQEEGRFDEQGNYVRKAADPDAIHDSWLEGVSRRDIRRAREAAEKRDAEQRQRDYEDDRIRTADLLGTLITHLQRAETVLEALARLGKGQRKKKPKWQTKPKKNPRNQNQNRNQNGAGTETETETAEEGDTAEDVARKQAIEAVTGAANTLFTRGQVDIYDVERELLTRQYRRETGMEWVDPPATVLPSPSPSSSSSSSSLSLSLSSSSSSSTATNGAARGAGPNTMWEYRWSDARDGGATHGPYDGATMQSWSDAGYFGEGVEVRLAGETSAWSSRMVAFT